MDILHVSILVETSRTMYVILHASRKAHRPLFAAAALLGLLVSSAQAVITTYTDETAYQIELLRLGYTTVTESFEDDAAWGTVRTTVSGPMTAPSISSQGITWTHNFPEVAGNNITTGSGPARTGNYGFFALPHGNYLSGPCTVPGHCADGFIGTTPSGTLMYAVGGWISSNQAKIGVYLDDDPTLIGFGGVGLTNAPAFFGVIDTDGFNQFKFQEQEGTKEDANYVFSDDFTIALAPGGCGENTPPTAAFTFAQTDADVNFTDTSSDSGSVVQWLWDFGDGNNSNQQNPSHTYLTNGNYSVILYVRDDGNCSGGSVPQTVFITTNPAEFVTISNPGGGATLKGSVSLEVTSNVVSSIEGVAYFLDGEEFLGAEDTDYSVSWDTTTTTDGQHTLQARLVKVDKTEIFSNIISIIVSNAPIDSWRRQHFSTADLANTSKEATLWGDLVDPDKDGNSNWKEYVFGGDPLNPSDANLFASVNLSTDSQGDPILEVTYRKRTNDPALTYTQEVSGDLIQWNSGSTHTTTLSMSPVDVDIEQVTFKGTGLGITEGRYFGRIRVTSL
jgi:PKD repeat protein